MTAESRLSSVTGGVMDGRNRTEQACTELEEETGFHVHPDLLIDLGQCYGAKSSTGVYNLFAVNVTNLKQLKAKGDGSKLEAMADAIWVSPWVLAKIPDPLVAALYLRLLTRLHLLPG